MPRRGGDAELTQHEKEEIIRLREMEEMQQNLFSYR